MTRPAPPPPPPPLGIDWQVGERLVRNIRSDLFAAIVMQDIAFFDKNKTGE